MGNTNTLQKSQGPNSKETQDQKDDQPTNSKEEPHDKEEEGSSFTCEICIEPMLSDNKFKNQDKCIHPFCMDCMAKYIQVKVVDDAASVVECPGLNCKELLDPFSCKPIIGVQLFNKWCDNLCESALNGFDRCYCPNRECSELVINECRGIVKGSSKCPNCKKLFCFRCKMSWHAGYRCDESGQLRDENDFLFGQLVEKRNWTRCPECGNSVQRINGCSRITCRCKTSFCYSCGAKIGGFLHICSISGPTTTWGRIFLGIAQVLNSIIWLVGIILFGPPLLFCYVVFHVARAIDNWLNETQKKPREQQPNDPNSNVHV